MPQADSPVKRVLGHWRLVLVAFALLLCILLATAPARLLGHLLPPALVLQGFKGSLWEGSADSAALALNGNYLQLGRLSWDLSPWSLLLLSPRAVVETRWGRQTLSADASVSPGGDIRLRDLSLTFPAQLVRNWLPVELRGSFNLMAPDVRLRELRPVGGAGRLVWQNARWIGDNAKARLGDYVLEFQVGEAQQLEGAVSTLAGPVTVSGDVSLEGQQYTLELHVSSEQGISQQMAGALELIAEPTDSGYKIALTGAL